MPWDAQKLIEQEHHIPHLGLSPGHTLLLLDGGVNLLALFKVLFLYVFFFFSSFLSLCH